MNMNLTMNVTMSTIRVRKSLSRRLPSALAALGFALALPSGAHAMAASVDDRFISTEVSAPLTLRAEAAPAAEPTLVRTRDDVKDDLQRARAINLMTWNTELGDTPDVLQAREDFYALQTEVMLAEQARVAEKMAQQEQAQRVALAGVLNDGDAPTSDLSLVADAGQTVQLMPTELAQEVESRLAAGHTMLLVVESDTEDAVDR